MNADNSNNATLSSPDLVDFPSDYFLQHKRDVDTLIDHLDYIGLTRRERATQTAIEVGAGVGMHTGYLSSHFDRVLATDILKYTALDGGGFIPRVVREHHRHAAPFDGSKIDFITSSAMNLVVRDDIADIAVSINTFEHIPNPALALTEMVRCVRPGGVIYIEFDPVWTADTGSHFINYVPEPWGHLVYSKEDFIDRMQIAGATAYEIASFTDGINRCRSQHFRDMLFEGEGSGCFAILSQTTAEQWSGVCDQTYLEHPFLGKALELGYSREELMLRGMRWVLRVL